MTTEPTNWLTRLRYTTQPVDDRSRMRAVMNNLILHLHPTKVPAPALRWRYTWGLGGLSAMLTVILIFTGVLLMFRYDASVERAYTSIQYLETEVLFGSLVRGVHHWSATLLVVTAFLHLVRVFLTGGYQNGRFTNWVIGLILLLLVLAFNFTGYLLPWDQLAYWAVTVGTSLLGYIPVAGQAISDFLLGGPEVGQATLRNFYAIHVAVLPTILVLLLSYHFWKVRKDGGISQPVEDGRSRVERLTTIPHLVRVELLAAVWLIASIVLFAMFVPAPLEALANPTHPPNPAKAAWYFMGLQELLLHMHPLAAMLLAVIVLGLLFFLPRLDPDGAQIGIYFRSDDGRRLALAGLLTALAFVPMLVLLDEYWLDLPGTFPTWPTIISNGVLPLMATLLGLWLIYGVFRWGGGVRHGEAVVGLFSFLTVSLVLLTIVGVFFRGPNMALVLPF